MHISTIHGEVNSDHLGRVVCAKFLHCKVTILPFQIIRILRADTLRLCKYQVLHLTARVS